MTADAIAAADAVVAAIEPGLAAPAIENCDVVVVTGPWLAGATSLIDALRERLPECTFVEADELQPTQAPTAVVFVVPADGPMTESDCVMVDLASRYTDLVVGVVSKIDTHRNWRDALTADREALTQRASRYAHVPWVGAAAAPDSGEPRVDELVGVLRQRLSDPDLHRRNRLRAWETRIETAITRYQSDGDGSDRRARVAALRQNRADVLRDRRLAKTERTIALRSQIQQARVQLGHYARNRCSSVRGELAEDVSQLSRRKLGAFEPYACTRIGGVVDEVEDGITVHLADMAAGLHLPAPPPPAGPARPDIAPPSLKSRRLETQLMTVLGAGFGLGVALMVTRLFAGLAPGLTVAGLVIGGVLGLTLTVWVVGIRGLLHHRAVLDRWVTDVTSGLRAAVEERVASRVLVAETALTSELAHRDEVEGSATAERVAEIDAELRRHALETARAAVECDRRLPTLRTALDAVRTELYGSGEPLASGRGMEPMTAICMPTNEPSAIDASEPVN